MSNPNITLPTVIPQNITDPPVQTEIGSIFYEHGSERVGCPGFWPHVVLVVPSVLFVLYLGFQAKRNLKKLSNRRSYIMIAYFALLWFAAVFNLAWSILQAWQCAPEKMIAWNILSLFTEYGMLSLEISIVAFLLQENYSIGLEPLAHTFIISGSIVAIDILLQAIFIFGFGVPLFINANNTHGGKWGLLFGHTLVVTAVYSYILFVHYAKWKDKLPPRPAFYNYVVVMFIINSTGLFASGLAGFSFGFGIWLYSFVLMCRQSLYLPFLYITFLADFFQEEDWLLENAYYSEMKDAGFFDTEWD